MTRKKTKNERKKEILRKNKRKKERINERKKERKRKSIKERNNKERKKMEEEFSKRIKELPGCAGKEEYKNIYSIIFPLFSHRLWIHNLSYPGRSSLGRGTPFS